MDSDRGLSRRDLLELGVTGGLAAALSASAFATELAGERPPATPASGAGRPRNIIFMVADGMSLGVPSLAEPFSRLARQRGTRWYELLRAPQITHGFFETHSLNSLVTDSAAASTAWSSGSRVFNGAINTLPDRTKLTPLSRAVRESGRRVGLVTTTTITHATPAGFATVQAHRDDEHLIAPQYLGEVDVLLGGGRKFFDAGWRADKHDLVGEFAARGYAFWSGRDDLRGPARPEKVLGLFGDGHLPFTLDHRNDAEIARRVPTLAEMTRAALAILGRDDTGFLLQVEGGRVDHAAHANDAAALLWDQLAFDDALDVVLEFCRTNPETLVVVTSDHGNANPGLNGMGREYRDTNRCFEAVAKATTSFERLVPRLKSAAGAGASAADVRTILQAGLGLSISDDDATLVADASRGELPPETSKQQRNLVGLLGQISGNHTGVGWTGTCHTADLVLTTALGPGAERFVGLLKNVEAAQRIAELLGVRHTNPRMAPAAAEPYLAAAPVLTHGVWA